MSIKLVKRIAFTVSAGFIVLSSINTAAMVKVLMNSMKLGEKKVKIEIAKKKVKPKQSKPAKASKPSQSTSLFNKSA